ncbi:MBL fold metallo-hydrolase [Krasilnikoviella flava]|uniref:L-ascorbate metabolism protein UlaG, beta-lactamase superfamily n=1 Tax=Krasilnikoviella flava TaxID=526729 RepID=A0A1T5LTD3_9MICO|nr:MBL fold metallo-hydrolase [Krasilnikoviella flava]SKC79232.1 L-ascorbate metabolism protein UlaG, beta-lactamase superfamily [Krasilnikoviella flava]
MSATSGRRDRGRCEPGPRVPGLGVTWLGHSTVVLDLTGQDGRTARFVTDPLLRRHAGVLRRRGVRPDAEAWRGTDAALLSHLHHDHAELGSLRLLGDVPVLTAPANARWLRGKGLRGVGLDPPTVPGDHEGVASRRRAAHDDKGGAWHEVAGAQVRLTAAVHGDRQMPHRPNAANGHLVRVPGATVWAVGDTEHYAGVGHVRELAGGHVDVALVPVSGWGPRLSGGHLGPRGAAEVCAEVRPRVAIPVHWGTLHVPGGQHLPRGWMDHAGAAFAAACHRVAPEVRAVVLRPGETWRDTPGDDDGVEHVFG